MGSDEFCKFSPCKLYKKHSGCIFLISGQKMKLFAVEFRRILEDFALQGFWKKFWVHFHDLCIQKWSCFVWSSDVFLTFPPCMLYIKCSGCIFTIHTSKNGAVCYEVQMPFWKFSLWEGLWKKIWSHFLDFCVQKRSCLLWSSDAFRKSSACKVYRKVLGVIPQFMRPKTTWFAMKFRCILEVLALQGLWKNICSHLLDFFVQKRSCLLLGSDEFCKFSPCKLYKKSSGCIFPILGQKMKLFAVEFGCIL